jgi:hypothetical protein
MLTFRVAREPRWVHWWGDAGDDAGGPRDRCAAAQRDELPPLHAAHAFLGLAPIALIRRAVRVSQRHNAARGRDRLQQNLLPFAIEFGREQADPGSVPAWPCEGSYESGPDHVFGHAKYAFRFGRARTRSCSNACGALTELPCPAALRHAAWQPERGVDSAHGSFPTSMRCGRTTSRSP